MNLNELRVGDCGRIISVGGTGALRRRLLEMGLTPGVRICVRKIAPLGDPIEICIRGYELTLRKEDISEISVELSACENNVRQKVKAGFMGMNRHRRYRGGRP